MNANCIYRDVMLVMAGLVAIGLLGSVALVNFTHRPPETQPDLESYDALNLLMTAEYARLTDRLRLSPNITIAVGSGLSELASQVLQGFSNHLIDEQPWEKNRGVPPPGTMLVNELRIEGNSGYVGVVIGETAGDLACGYKIESQYSWRGQWTGPDNTLVIVC
jgi:hypothetical protein